MRQSLQLNLGQRLALTPQLRQAIKLLQLSTIDLRLEIQEALERNPLLEETDGYGELQADAGSPSGDEDTATRLELAPGAGDDEPVERGEAIYTATQTRPQDGSVFDLDQHNSAPPSLRSQLLEQVGLTPFSSTDREIASAIVYYIDDDGYLGGDLEEIRQSIDADVGIDEIEAVLHQIQNYDPVGVGARSLSECLRLQLLQRPADTEGLELALRIVAEHLECLGSRDLARLGKRTQSSEGELRTAVDLVQSLNPRPGSALTPSPPDYVIPDILVTQEHAGWRVELNPDALPQLRVNELYRDLTSDPRASNRQYIHSRLQEARWLVNSLQHRNRTLLRVAREVLERQQQFLAHGETAMRPMVLHDISDALEIHESTVSRATTNKYVLTPRGIFELKYFFSAALGTKSGEVTSATAIQSRLRKLIDQEPTNKPYSDNKLTELLNQVGIEVARRTVAKYREALKIPPSSQRKVL